MNYAELIANIRDLGFSDDAEMEEFGELVPNSINRAITEINLGVAPIVKNYELEIDTTDDGYIYVVMPDIDGSFLDFRDIPVMFEKEGTQYYKKFANYDIEADNTVVINADENKGSFRIFYKAAHTPFTGDETMLAADIPLPLKVHHLVPLLASYYIWLEDEPAKAAQYYNLYEQKVQDMLLNSEANKIKAKVLSGGI